MRILPVADGTTEPGWPERLRLLLRDLVAFDPHRLNWMLAVRTVLGLAMPLLAAHAFHLPQLLWTGLGAYLLAIGDCIDDGDRAQPTRIIVGAVLGAAALATGVVAGGNFATAVAGMMVWGVFASMLGVYGNAFAAMSLPIAWAYVELGLPARDHSLSNALATGGLFMMGGSLMLVLTMLSRVGGALRPVRAQTTACFRELASYLQAERRDGPETPEQRVRGAIAGARRVAAQAQQNAGGMSRVNQRALMLIEVADRLYSIIAAMRETDEPPIPECKTVLLAIVDLLGGRARIAELRRLRSRLAECHRTGTAPSDPAFGAAGRPVGLERRLTDELDYALSLAHDDDVPTAATAVAAASGTRLAAALAPIRANFSCSSLVARHALRFALVTAAAVVVFWFFPKPFGYWVPLTATAVLKPYAGTTLGRVIQRLLGTLAGILVGLALMPLLPGMGMQFAATMLLFFGMMTVLPFNYALAIGFLSAGIVPFEHLLNPDIRAAIGTDRLVATAIGAALALIGGNVLWPDFERRGLPDLLRDCIAGTAVYADSLLGAAQGGVTVEAAQEKRRAAGVGLTNLQVGIQHALAEIGGDADTMTATLQAAAALQRLSNTLNALLQIVPMVAPSRPALAAFRDGFVAALANPCGGEPGIDSLSKVLPAHGQLPEHAALHAMLDQALLALEMLHHATSRLLALPASSVARPGKVNGPLAGGRVS